MNDSDKNLNCDLKNHKAAISFWMLAMAVLVFAQLASVIVLFLKHQSDTPTCSLNIDKPHIHLHSHENNYDDDLNDDDEIDMDNFVDMEEDSINKLDAIIAKSLSAQKIIPKGNNPVRPGQHIVNNNLKQPQTVKKNPDKQPKK